MGIPARSRTTLNPEVHQKKSHTPRIGCLLIHGFTGTPWAMQELADVLSGRDIRTKVPLLPGHGSSPDDLANVTWKAWVATCSEALHALQKDVDRCYVLGHSIGGVIALHLASEIPVNGVVTLSAPYRLDDWRLPFIPLIKPFKPHWPKRRARAHPLTPEMGYDRYPLNGVAQCQKLIRATQSRLARVQCPALLMHARKDHRVPLNNVYRLAQALGSSDIQVQLLEHPAHTITRGEDRDTVFQRVITFLSPDR